MQVSVTRFTGGTVGHVVALGPTEQTPGALDCARVIRQLSQAIEAIGGGDTSGAKWHAGIAFAMLAEHERSER